MTYSIVARDPIAGEFGAAVQSAWYGTAIGVLLVVPGVGAGVSQAMGERAFTHQVIELLSAGSTPANAVAAVMDRADSRALSQIAVIDRDSTPAAYTGRDCIAHAGHRVGVDCAAQVNMMANPGVPDAMVAAFEESQGDLGACLLAALDAAQASGGDFRGMQSAGLIVRSAEPDVPEWQSTVIDARVDDHHEPLRELRRLIDLDRMYRSVNEPFKRLAAGDADGAVAAARQLHDLAPSDLNVQMRLGVALLAAGDPQGRHILSRLAATNAQWITYARRSLERYGADPTPLLDELPH